MENKDGISAVGRPHLPLLVSRKSSVASLSENVTWSESSLSAFWIAKDVQIFHADNEDFDQTSDAQVDLSLHSTHMSERKLSHVATQIMHFIPQ